MHASFADQIYVALSRKVIFRLSSDSAQSFQLIASQRSARKVVLRNNNATKQR